MEGAHHQHAVLGHELPVLPGDLEIRVDQAAGSDAAEADDDFRPDERNLFPQVGDARLLLLRQRVAVFRRPAFDDVGDINILPAGQAHRGEHFIQQLAAAADERLALQILVFAGAFPHKQHLRLRVAHPKHHVMPRSGERTRRAAPAFFLERRPFCRIHPVILLFPPQRGFVVV